MDGNMRFILGQSNHPHQTFDRLKQIAPKQMPIAAILGCADSRVPAEIVFDQVCCCCGPEQQMYRSPVHPALTSTS